MLSSSFVLPARVSAQEPWETLVPSGYCFQGTLSGEPPSLPVQPLLALSFHQGSIQQGHVVAKMSCLAAGHLSTGQDIHKISCIFFLSLKKFLEAMFQTGEFTSGFTFLVLPKVFHSPKAGFCKFIEGLRKSLNCFFWSDLVLVQPYYLGMFICHLFWCMSFLLSGKSKQSKLC